MRETITPKDRQEWLELKSKDVTSTEVSALFGISPYCTIFELWHQKKNKEVVEIEDNERMEWGKALQDTIGSRLAEQMGWKVRRMNEYMRGSKLRIGASFDFSIEKYEDEKPVSDGIKEGPVEPAPVPKIGLGILEVKNVDSLIFKNTWNEDDDGYFEAPPHIEIQLQHQLLVSGRTFGFIAVLVGGNRLVLIERKAEPQIHEKIKEKVKAFWQSIEDGVEPEVDFARDAKAISKLYGFADPDKLYAAEGDKDMLKWVQGYYKLAQEIKLRTNMQKEFKTRILQKVQDAEKAISSDFSITLGMVGATHVEYDRKAYRMFKINPKKHIKEPIEAEVWKET